MFKLSAKLLKIFNITVIEVIFIGIALELMISKRVLLVGIL